MEIEFKNLEKSVKNLSCNYDYVPSAIENIESLGTFGIGLLSFGAILSTLTLYFALDACHNIFYQKETKLYKTNSITILSVYPVASICSLTALGIPRTQLLSEAVTQIFLTISLYRLHLLLVYVGRKKVTTTPPLVLRVGPCCCWPCLPFPRLEMTDANLSWVRLLVLQLPIIQGLTYCIFLFMSIEEPSLITQYGICLQPFMVISILLGIYGLTITLKSLQEVAPVTYNALMLIEMLLLCYAARYVYYVELEREEETAAVEATDRSKDKSTEQATSTNNNEANRQPSALTA
ncbi:PREDICTED: organic solute transporter alpha-like protein isoform X2 [Eufriesea mexicana]|uniref:organic solute transporter alpha-like protein isoform X2 n=1 Tax=Eufriesea mexicana TaxID=516756 RepID=UPI00083C24D9|nr:PREDICTED: organic solute transporter alpha-like protein isoform X2 [Eufriesea mexicana]